MEVELSENLREAFPDIKVAVLEAWNVVNKSFDLGLEGEKRRLEAYIRENYKNLGNFEVVKSYNRFFKRWGKTYPVQFQVKSIVKGRKIPARSTLVEAMFMAELKNLYLTAGHDLDALKGEKLNTRLAEGTEEYVKLNGERQRLEAGDIITMDGEGIISSVLYGPDLRTRITDRTRSCLFFTYFPYGEEDGNIKRHFQNIAENIKIFSAEARFSEAKIFHL